MPSIILFLGDCPLEARGQSSGEKLQDYRRKYGLSQKELAKEIGIDQATLSRLEKNNSRCLEQVVKKAANFICKENSKEDQ